MYRALGFTRDPFAPVWDAELFWENPQRAEARQVALAALREQRGVWLEGPPGAGREALLDALADELAFEGRPALRLAGGSPRSAEELVGAILRELGEPAERPDPGAAYAALMNVFVQRGTLCLCLGGTEPLETGPAGELEILAGLRLVGYPLAVLALAGQGRPPVPGLTPISVPPFSVPELRACLLHRLAACGRADPAYDREIERAAARAGGVGDALACARAELARASLLGELPAGPAPAVRPGGVFDANELREVGLLLDALSPEAEPE